MDKKLDVTGAYPTNETVFNISKETTYREICSIEGITEHEYRMSGINLSAGHVNAVEFCQVIFKLPSMDQMLAHYEAVKHPVVSVQ